VAVSSGVNESVVECVPSVNVSVGTSESVSETVMSLTDVDMVTRRVREVVPVSLSDTVNVSTDRETDRSTEEDSSSETVMETVRRVRLTVAALSDSDSLTVRTVGDGRDLLSVMLSDSDSGNVKVGVPVGGGVRVAEVERFFDAVNW
jgi:hypothetical protein